MKLFFRYLKDKILYIILFISFVGIYHISFYLYELPQIAVIYPSALCALIGVIFLAAGFVRTARRHSALMKIMNFSSETAASLPPPDGVADSDYTEIINLLCDEMKQRENLADKKYNAMMDYYTMWAHQIKTPIASMSLRLQQDDSALSRELNSDLLRIEQYADIVLAFLRLDSYSTDYLIKTYPIDSIIKQAVKKYASEFILRRLKLNYTPTDVTVVTDEKWLSFVIEQVLSNALKYTPSGEIAIYMEGKNTLCIRDSGIGIAPEDLPRIFDNGYTGMNGREDKKASGIGLYLCRRICTNLGHTITAESSGDGTTIKIDMTQKRYE